MQQNIKFSRTDLRFYAVTDHTHLKDRSLLDCVQAAISGGVSCVQLREKNIDSALFLKRAFALKQLCTSFHIPLIINDNVDVARLVSASGIHIGQNDLPAAHVRKLIGDTMILGVSVHNLEEALQAQSDGADYVGVGAIFPTSTKHDAHIISMEMLTEICQTLTIPVVAIGGINSKNISQLDKSGVSGIALSSALFSQQDIKKKCQELFLKIEHIIK